MKDFAALERAGAVRLAAAKKAAIHPHPFVPHRHDNRCDVCLLSEENGVHWVKKGIAPGRNID